MGDDDARIVADDRLEAPADRSAQVVVGEVAAQLVDHLPQALRTHRLGDDLEAVGTGERLEGLGEAGFLGDLEELLVGRTALVDRRPEDVAVEGDLDRLRIDVGIGVPETVANRRDPPVPDLPRPVRALKCKSRSGRSSGPTMAHHRSRPHCAVAKAKSS